MEYRDWLHKTYNDPMMDKIAANMFAEFDHAVAKDVLESLYGIKIPEYAAAG